jgi:hypothetical protein
MAKRSLDFGDARPPRQAQINPKKVVALGLVAIFAIVMLVLGGQFAENVDADRIMVVQSPVAGELTFHTDAGLKWQGFGKVTTYLKRSIYTFEAPVQFNDGGKGVIFGSVQYDMPLDVQNLTELHTRFGSQAAIQDQVMRVITNKVIYMTGPIMSSRESYAEKRNYLINYAQDQIDNGVYQTRQGQTTVTDELSGQEKTVSVAEIVRDEAGNPLRQEDSIVGEFGIRAFNFAIERIDYDDRVEAQIQEQQQINMDVQTSIADALKAQQAAITAEQQGKANAETAKWEKEVEKARQVTEAGMRLEVAQLDRKAAEETKKKEILLGEGTAKRRQLEMAADGALDKKLAAYVETQKYWADAIAKYEGNWVPEVQMGSDNGKGMNGAQALMEFLTVKAAKDLQLDMRTKKN